jgi:hypothetical protein
LNLAAPAIQKYRKSGAFPCFTGGLLTFTPMEPSTQPNPARKVWQSIFINAALALYAMGTFVGSLQKGEAWRIVLSGVGSVFFIAVIISLVLQLKKLRRSR